MPTPERERMVPIDKIKTNTFVRVKLNEDHVHTLETLITSGAQITPILVTEQTLAMVDGRHRLQAYRQLGYETIRVRVRGELSDPELMAVAMKENLGGALPPSMTDIHKCIAGMVNLGCKNTEVYDMLSCLPKKLVSLSLEYAKVERRKRLVRQALRLMETGDLTAKQAAKELGVELAEVQEILQRRQRSEKDVRQIQADISHATRSMSKKMSNAIQSAIDLKEIGAIDKDTALDVVDTVIRSEKRLIATAEQHKQRLLVTEG